MKQQLSHSIERASMMIEAVVALGIVSIGALSIVGLLGQSNASSQENGDKEAAIQSLGFVRRELKAIPFAEVYEVLKGDAPPYYSYQYLANPNVVRRDGSAQPDRAPGSRLRKGFRRGDDPLFKEDLEFRDGAVYRIRLSPLLDNGATPLSLPAPDQLVTPGFSLALEFFIDPLPGESEEEWKAMNRVLRVPVSISR